MLAVLGGVLAVAVGFLLKALLASLLLPGVTGSFLSLRVVLAFSTLTAAVALACGLPIPWLSVRNLIAEIRTGVAAGSPGQARVRGALITRQIALTLVLLIGAAVFFQSLQKVTGIPLAHLKQLPNASY